MTGGDHGERLARLETASAHLERRLDERFDVLQNQNKEIKETLHEASKELKSFRALVEQSKGAKLMFMGGAAVFGGFGAWVVKVLPFLQNGR